MPRRADVHLAEQGEPVLRLDVWVDEEGQVQVGMETERSPEEVAALLEIVADKIAPTLDRADETEAWGSRRRRRP